MDLWELVARERIRDTLARYNWAGDAGKLTDMADTFCPDGILELRGTTTLTGRSAIVEFLGGVTGRVRAEVKPDGKPTGKPTNKPTGKPIVRHNVANILFAEVTPQQARVSCYFTVFTHIGLDHSGRYRDTLVPVGNDWLIKHRLVSTDWAAPDSTMARD